jgi:hypothetical protein
MQSKGQGKGNIVKNGVDTFVVIRGMFRRLEYLTQSVSNLFEVKI